MLCDDEKAYQLYMAYLDARERGDTDDSAINAALTAAKDAPSAPLPDTTLSTHFPSGPMPAGAFVCKPVDQ